MPASSTLMGMASAANEYQEYAKPSATPCDHRPDNTWTSGRSVNRSLWEAEGLPDECRQPRTLIIGRFVLGHHPVP